MKQSRTWVTVVRRQLSITTAIAAVIFGTSTLASAAGGTPITVYHYCPEQPCCECTTTAGKTVVGRGNIEIDFGPVWAAHKAWSEAWRRLYWCWKEYGEAECEAMGIPTPEYELEVLATIIDARLEMFGHTFVTEDFQYGFRWEEFNLYNPHAIWITVGDAEPLNSGVGDPGVGWGAAYDGDWFFSYLVNGNRGYGHDTGWETAGWYWGAPPIDVALNASSIAGCQTVIGTVTIPGPAPAAGSVVTLSDTLSSAIAPATVTIPAGRTSIRFTLDTLSVSVPETGTMVASFGGESLGELLTVRPMGMLSLSVRPRTVVGSQPASGKVTLECKAGPGQIAVALSSGDASLARPAAASITIPAGVQSQSFPISTAAVQSKSDATITATANGTSKAVTLSLIPAASVSPSILRFGDREVGVPSATMSLVLSNAGTVPYSVVSIGVSGKDAAQFMQTNNCPAVLSAGATCTIGVAFTPSSTRRKVAQVEIATSATSVPLLARLSGTGI